MAEQLDDVTVSRVTDGIYRHIYEGQLGRPHDKKTNFRFRPPRIFQVRLVC